MLLLTALTSFPAQAANLFIQVMIEDRLPTVIDSGEDPGRVEIEINGTFVGCARAAVYEDKWDQSHLLPLSLGYTASGRKEDVKVTLHGALRRSSTARVLISELPQTPTAVNKP